MHLLSRTLFTGSHVDAAAFVTNAGVAIGVWTFVSETLLLLFEVRQEGEASNVTKALRAKKIVRGLCISFLNNVLLCITWCAK
jgi:hypothetical protein